MNTEITVDELMAVQEIAKRIPGWSDAKQFAFFRNVLGWPHEIKRILMLGVYQGRDISLILAAAKRLCPDRPLEIVGVDKFEDTACADWPAHLRNTSWKMAGFGDAPTLDKARLNIAETIGEVPGGTPERLTFTNGTTIEIVKAIDVEWLAANDRKFDLVYLDTSHDFETVAHQLRLVRRSCALGALVCGDDYTDDHGWGVKRAVEAGLNRHQVFAGWIWWAPLDALKS